MEKCICTLNEEADAICNVSRYQRSHLTQKNIILDVCL